MIALRKVTNYLENSPRWERDTTRDDLCFTLVDEPTTMVFPNRKLTPQSLIFHIARGEKRNAVEVATDIRGPVRRYHWEDIVFLIILIVFGLPVVLFLIASVVTMFFPLAYGPLAYVGMMFLMLVFGVAATILLIAASPTR